MKYFFKQITILLILALCSINMLAQQEAKQYIETKNYLLYLPQNYDANDAITKWPTIIFLHGVGEVGDDVNVVRGHGLAKLIEEGKQFPFIIISPQSPKRGWESEFIIKLLDEIKNNYHVDEDRVYLTGLSMGGYGTWNTASNYVRKFAAILPICGGGQLYMARRLQWMPIWNFHGAKDEIVPIIGSEIIIEALKPISDRVKYTIFPEAGHHIWDQVYSNDSIYDWLLSHKRFRFKEIELKKEQLSKFVGIYEKEDDKLIIAFDSLGTGLEFKWGESGYANPIKPFSEKEFFLNENQVDWYEFTTDKLDKVIGMTVYPYWEKLIPKIE